MAFTVGEILVATGPYTAESSPVYLADLEDVSDESPGEGQALVWDGEEWTFGDVGSMSSFTLAGDSGTNQTIADGNTLTILGGRGLATATSATDTITINLPTGTSGQVLKHNGSAWVAGTDTDTTYSAGTGLSLGGTTFSLSHLGIQSLSDPGADRILFWDESENASKWLTLGTNLAISGTTINATDTNTTYSAGTGLNLATTTFSLSHLGIQSLADPNADRILFWDDSEGASKWLELGTNLSITGTTLNASASAGITNFTLAGDSGTPQTISDGNTLTISGSGGITAVAGATDKVTIGLPSGSSGQVLKHNGSAWVAGTDTDTTYTAGTGLSLGGTQFSLSHLGIQSLSDPGADRILFWDESENASKWLTLGTNLAISGTTINATDTNTTYSAGTGLNLATTTFSLSHLGIQSLADPNADRILFWDDSEGASKWLELGTNLSITGTTLNASASAGITNFTLAGDSGTPQTISDGNTLTISGSGGITAVAGATDKVTIGLPSGSSGQVLKHNGTAWVAGTDTDTTYTAFTGDSGSGGAAGLVPAPGAGDTAAGKYLKASGGWATPPDTNTTYSAGTGLNLATTTFNHSNSVSAQSTARLDKVAYDAQGHVTSSSAAALGDLSNVNASSPSNGQVLKYSTSSSKWEAATDETGSGSLPSGTEHQTLRHNGTTWAATSGMLSTGSLVTITGPSQQACIPLKVLTPRDNVNDLSEIEFGTSQSNGEDNNPYGVIGIKITNNSQYSRAGTIQIRPGSNSALVNGVSVTGADTTIHGVLKAGTTPTTLTNSSGKVLLSAMADSLPPVVSAPAGSGSSGTANQIAFDASYFYVCTGSNTWKRIAWTAW